jgi:putative ABC transport system ATP-binding protein
MSGGQQQRVAIARALVNQPRVILADEPTGNLDSVNSRMILELFKDLNSRLGLTVVMITHNPEAAAVGHRTIEMRDGRVVSHGVLPQLVTGAGT